MWFTDDDGVKIQDDPRPAHQRRMDALLDIIARGVSAPGEGPFTDKAKIVVTIDLDALREHVAHGRAHGGAPAWATRKKGGGSCLSGDVLSAATVRRMACDAAIIPVILGSQRQPLDVGRQERLVTRAIGTALWIRDAGCTFPGCTTPAHWTDAHHVKHWLHGGPTSLTNLALLCPRHHTHVHTKNLVVFRSRSPGVSDERCFWRFILRGFRRPACGRRR